MSDAPPPTTKIYVGNVPSPCRRSDLQSLFEKYGAVAECDIVKDYAFVHFQNLDDAKAAVSALDGFPFEGRKLAVQHSRSKVRQKPGMGSDDVCFRCGNPGHWSKDCPRGGRERRPRPSPYGAPSSRDSYYSRERYAPSSRDSYSRESYSRSYYDRAAAYDDYYRRPPPPPSRDYYRERDPYGRPPPPDYYRSRTPPRDPYGDQYYSRYATESGSSSRTASSSWRRD